MRKIDHKECVIPVRDALDVLSGKWKLLILISIAAGFNKFKDIERNTSNISPKVLAKELKDLEEHRLVKRTVYDETPVVIEYSLTPYAETLENVILALRDWGTNHRKQIFSK